MSDIARERGTKQNIQFTKEKAFEFRECLNNFLNQERYIITIKKKKYAFPSKNT